ncbi:MAG: hypothetical protein NTV48_00345 [Candidatus Vogelbacteria bacterium]|nr:hypothetical protein [Candidatus Vogelbacteria bacterium]
MSAIEVIKSNNESNSSLIRRFTKRIQGSGVVRKARNRRYNERLKSELKKKREALKKLVKRADYERMKKLGKVKDAS